jgi:hypothetical protein
MACALAAMVEAGVAGGECRGAREAAVAHMRRRIEGGSGSCSCGGGSGGDGGGRQWHLIRQRLVVASKGCLWFGCTTSSVLNGYNCGLS